MNLVSRTESVSITHEDVDEQTTLMSSKAVRERQWLDTHPRPLFRNKTGYGVFKVILAH